ncbi:MAG: DUF4124 domain-containing protein [Gammaproteobacteria bacterium]
MRRGKKLAAAIMILLGMSVLTSALAEQIYKSVDAQGNVVYSDQPSSGAQQITPPPISITPTPTVAPLPPINTSTQDTQSTSIVKVYTQLDILSPLNDQTIWDNNGNINVSVALAPKLAAGDQLQVIVDGKVLAESNTTTNFTLNSLERGTHVLQVQIINNKKQVVKVSNVVTFYLHKAIAACNSPLQTCLHGDCQIEMAYLADHIVCQQIFMDKLEQAENRYQTCKENDCPQLIVLKQEIDQDKVKIQKEIQIGMTLLENNLEQCKATNCSQLAELKTKYFVAEANIIKFKIHQCERTHCKEKQELKNKYEAAKKQA